MVKLKEGKREIHALDYAVVRLMVFLDMLFSGIVDNWINVYPSRGLDLDVTFKEPLASVKIYPIGWPRKNSLIVAEFFGRPGTESSWMLTKVAINAPHLGLKTTLDGGYVYPDLKAMYGAEEDFFMRRARRHLLENLKCLSR